MKQNYLLALAIVAVAASTGFGQTTSIPINDYTFNTPSAPTNGYTLLAGGAGNSGYAAFNAQGWTITEGENAIVSIQAPNPAPTAVGNQDNSQNLEVFENSTYSGWVDIRYQTAADFVAGDTYDLTVDATVFAGDNVLGDPRIYIDDNYGNTVAALELTGLTPGAYQQYSVPFTSTGYMSDTGPIVIGFELPVLSPSVNDYIELDNFALTQIAPVPEPRSIAIAALGGLVLLGLLRRRAMKRSHLLALAIVAVAASTSFSQTSAPISNYSFETPAEASGSYEFLYGPSINALQGWTVTSGGAIVDVIHPSTPPANIDGVQTLEDLDIPGDWNSPSSIDQTLSTDFVAGDTYELTVYAGTFSGERPQTGDSIFIANSAGTVLASTAITGIAEGTLSKFTVPFVSTGFLGDTGAIQVGFFSANQITQSWMEVDDFSLTVVPEPSSIAIVALGGFGLLRRKRMNRS